MTIPFIGPLLCSGLLGLAMTTGAVAEVKKPPITTTKAGPPSEGNASALKPHSKKRAAKHEFKDQDAVSLNVRAQRNF